jgi:hypothetical protein
MKKTVVIFGSILLAVTIGIGMSYVVAARKAESLAKAYEQDLMLGSPSATPVFVAKGKPVLAWKFVYPVNSPAVRGGFCIFRTISWTGTVLDEGQAK